MREFTTRDIGMSRMANVGVAVDRWSPLGAVLIWSAISAAVWLAVVGVGAILF